MIDIDNFKAVNDAHGHSVRRRGAEIDRQGAPDRGERSRVSRPDRGRGVRVDRSGPKRRRRLSTAERARDAVGVGLGSGHRALLLGGSRGVSGRRRGRRQASASSPRAPSIGRSAAARAARAASTPGTCRSPGPGAAPPRSTELLDGDQPDHPGLPARGGSRERAPGRLRGAGALHGLAEALTRGLVRPGARLRPRARTSRRRRSGPPSSRWAGRSGPISRSTSAPPRSPPRPVVRALPTDLTGIVIEITEHEFVSDDDHFATSSRSSASEAR